MCESKSEKGLSYEIKCTSCKDAQLAERKLLLCSPLARKEFRKRNSYLFPRTGSFSGFPRGKRTFHKPDFYDIQETKERRNMSLPELFAIAVALSMDAFAVSVCKGLSVQKAGVKECCIAGLYFGGFQALMPAIGYFLGVQFREYITSIDHWIAFILLGLIGVNMIRESREKESEDVCPREEHPFAVKSMLLLAIATSIDALAVGITLAFLKVNLAASVSFIGVITFLLSALGIRIGNIFGVKYKSKAELVGGVILICMGLKILLEHVGVFG